MSIQSADARVGRDHDYQGAKSAAWIAFALTFLLNVFDYVDRQIVVSMLPDIKTEWVLSDTQLGALVSVVSLTVAIMSLPVAILADRWSRVKCIALMAIVWSLATIACGYAVNYFQLVSLRGIVGIGEAGYGAVGTALLATLFPSRMRAFILASLQAGAVVGAIGGVILGGVITRHLGWHSAFGIVGVPGLILAVLFFFVRDYKAPKLAPKRTTGFKPLGGAGPILRQILKTPSTITVFLCNGFQYFVFSTMVAWLPSFMHRSYNLPTDKAAMRTAIILIATTVGAMLWGAVADRMSRKNKTAKYSVMSFTTFMTFVVLGFAFNFLSPGPAQYGTLVFGAIFLGGTIGTVSASAMDVALPAVRSTTVAIGTLIQVLTGFAAGPVVSGMLSDAFGLSTALAIVPLASLLATIGFILTRPIYGRDLDHAAARDAVS